MPALLAFAAPLASAPALAADPPATQDAAPERDGVLAVVLRVAIVQPPSAGGVPPDPRDVELAERLGMLLTDTAQDLGLTLDLSERRGPPTPEHDLADQAREQGRVLLAPSFSVEDGDVVLRLALARPGSRALIERVERVSREGADVRAAVMLRDLVREAQQAPAALAPSAAAAAAPRLAVPPRSAGRAALAVSATAFGGFVGYSVLRSSGSDDPRLLYPLLAVGAGVGLGGSIIAAEEWDVGAGDAWFLASGAFWPALAGHLIYEGRFDDPARPSGDRWSFGLVGGATGLSIAALGLTLHGISEGGAVVAHSGGGLGLMFGGLAELAVRGDIYRTPATGLGYGAGIGWLAGAAIAEQVHVTPGRVLALDLGAMLGGLGGAALASPLLFDSPSANAQRAWLGATAGAAIVGAGIGWYAAREAPAGRPAARGAPLVGVLGESATGSRRAPIYGAGWQGRW